MRRVHWGILGLACLVVPPAQGADVRSHTRPTNPVGTSVSDLQASVLTLTLTEASLSPIQAWVRASGKLAPGGATITSLLRGPDGDLVKVGQRVRCFSPAARAQMHQGRVSSVSKRGDQVVAQISLANQVEADGSRYVVEFVTDRGEYLSVPNVSIIEEGDRHVVYVQRQADRYEARDVQTGLQGELYTQILGGLEPGDQVVSIGSFFIDAENKLKSPGAGMAAMPGMDHSSMPGMDHSKMAGMAPAPDPAGAPPLDRSERKGMTSRPAPSAMPGMGHGAMPGMGSKK